VRLDLEGPVAALVLDHPEAANALSGVMLAELADAVDALEAWDGVAVLARGRGDRAFCAGADLRMVREQLRTPEDGLAMCRFMQALTQRILHLPQVTCAALEGATLGGGAELATAFDHRVSGGGRICFVQARLGLSPGWGGGARLVRLVGRSVALELLAGSVSVEGPRSLAIGLVDALAEPARAEAEARRLLERYTRWPVESVRAAKRLVAEASEASLAHGHEVAAAGFSELWSGPANRSALAALDKGRG